MSLPSGIPLQESGDTIVLRISENGRGGWFLGAFRASDPRDADNLLLDSGTAYAAGTKFDIDAMNIPEYEDYPEPLMLPIRSTDMALCVDFANARAHGSGAAAGFAKGSVIDIRVFGEGGHTRLSNTNLMIYVLDTDGHPLHGAAVSLVRPGGRPTDRDAIPRMSNARGEAGFLTAPGRYEAVVSSKGSITSRYGPFDLGPGSVHNLRAVLNRFLEFPGDRGELGR